MITVVAAAAFVAGRSLPYGASVTVVVVVAGTTVAVLLNPSPNDRV